MNEERRAWPPLIVEKIVANTNIYDIRRTILKNNITENQLFSAIPFVLSLKKLLTIVSLCIVVYHTVSLLTRQNINFTTNNNLVTVIVTTKWLLKAKKGNNRQMKHSRNECKH